jgi:hypothetical protein
MVVRADLIYPNVTNLKKGGGRVVSEARREPCNIVFVEFTYFCS